MSGDSRATYSNSFRETSGYYDRMREGDDSAYQEMKAAIKSTKEKMAEKENVPRPERKKDTAYNKDYIRPKITRPAPGIQRVHITLVDNSSSNRAIARHVRNTSAYLTASLQSIDPQSQMAFDYFSDHCDGDRIMQEVDFFSPDETGDKIVVSTVSNIQDAGGGDAPEAIECALYEACKIDFGDAIQRHLYLVTDQVAHGMGGGQGDDGCPLQRDWKKSIQRVRETFTTFEVVGCGDDQSIADVQRTFLSPERVAKDFIDLSSIKEDSHRLGITSNALLFLIARKSGVQTVELFLSFLYQKWLEDPIFGKNTDVRAQEAIRRFGKYLEEPTEKIEKMMNRILCID